VRIKHVRGINEHGLADVGKKAIADDAAQAINVSEPLRRDVRSRF
jgi:hypothetical protein